MGERIPVSVFADKIPKDKEAFRFVFQYRLIVSLSSSVLRKMILLCVVLSMCLLDARAEGFGISRRTPAQPQQQPNQQQILPYVVRIIAFEPSGQSFGTGSYVGTYGEYGVVLTNHHVVHESGGSRLVHVHFPSGFSSFGAVIKTDELWDLALLAISKPPLSIPTLSIASTPARPGDQLWIVGFGSGDYRIAPGRCVRYLAPDENAPNELIEVSVSARKGDSGGPILNQRGELSGVLFGSDMVRNTAGSYSGRVNRFLVETQRGMARLPARPETLFSSIESNGPVHSLWESRNVVPQNASAVIPQRAGYTGPAASSFGIRSSFPR